MLSEGMTFTRVKYTASTKFLPEVCGLFEVFAPLVLSLESSLEGLLVALPPFILIPVEVEVFWPLPLDQLHELPQVNHLDYSLTYRILKLLTAGLKFVAPLLELGNAGQHYLLLVAGRFGCETGHSFEGRRFAGGAVDGHVRFDLHIDGNRNNYYKGVLIPKPAFNQRFVGINSFI